MQIKVAPKQVQNEEKGDMREISLPVEDKENDNKPFATLEELKSGRLPPEEILSLPMFKVLEVWALYFFPWTACVQIGFAVSLLSFSCGSVTWLFMFLMIFIS